ncbi:S41 family peptidase [Christiangramia sp. OXR-203]|jgi:carboxyl-terminal processing protease|uniref:S41 family peptidase n=1 Tax=Christiangramia sp. OXR-203 TaxID=3100176 RepID=UPI002AC8B180|nr:S41 family peptidase [Christiangramia sp. OXR-203]WPY98722.1 S41 family peptidase [Christiangramia sp. OXR-203]
MKKNFKKLILLPVLLAGIFIGTVSFKSDFFEIAKQIEIFTTLFKEINMNYVDETNPAQLMDSAIKSMLTDLDPYTNYWNEQDVEAARINNSGEYTGIGAAVKNGATGITIVEAYKDYPADKAGLKAGDLITKIGDIRVSDFKEDAGELLNGASETAVEITFVRQGKEQKTSLKRESVDLSAVPFYKLLEDNTGYIVLSRFNAKASTEVSRALKELKNQGAEKIILDLRGNPGGLLSEAINVSNIFVPANELIVTTRSAIEKYNKDYYTQREPIDTKIPLVVLVNGRSASASEIVAGAMQDLDRGVIVGARSFGKGLVQRPRELAYGTQLKITISRYYTPSGRCIQALDYRRRDENGRAVRTKVEDYNEFNTRNGRKVYDGGGILPDVKLETSEFSDITQALLLQDAIFNYATEYYYSHKVEDLKDFDFNDADFQEFKVYLRGSDFDYVTATEKELEELIATSEEENLELKFEASGIRSQLEQHEKQELELRKPEIISLLKDEIIKRYFYKEGLYEYYTVNNPEIAKAREILNSENKYAEILK